MEEILKSIKLATNEFHHNTLRKFGRKGEL
jgi:hypothetical protein